jgi:DNA-binding NtrC family response regulator
LDIVDFPQIASAMGVSPERRSSPGASAIVVGASPKVRSDSPYALSGTDAAGHMRKLEELEAELIRMAISRYEGRMSEVARRLGIGRSTLYRKLKEFGLEESDDGDDEDTEYDVKRASA